MLPFMRQLEDGNVHTIKDVLQALTKEFNLTEEERSKLLPSGTDRTFDNRVGWARTHLGKAGLFETVGRGKYRITQRGRAVLVSNPRRIDVGVLKQFPEYLEFIAPTKLSHQAEAPATTLTQAVANEKETPLEVLERTYTALRKTLTEDLLQTVREASPKFFERLVVDLLVAMGYGGSRADVGHAVTGKPGDEGIDGVIKEDKLGLDVVLIQAKRWKACIGRPEIQAFAGSLLGKRAKKGVFMTTSHFSPEAHDYVSHIDQRIVLINGEELAAMMIDYGVGISEPIPPCSLDESPTSRRRIGIYERRQVRCSRSASEGFRSASSPRLRSLAPP